jgi:hypothetical protein
LTITPSNTRSYHRHSHQFDYHPYTTHIYIHIVSVFKLSTKL